MDSKPQTPPNTRIYAIGDIHGRLDLLTRLLNMIEENALRYPLKQKRLIFLGDYIDRGLESHGVIERLTGEFAHDIEPLFIRGNHDDRLIRFLEGQLDVVPSWLQFGGTATLASYGIPTCNDMSPNRLAKLQKDLLEKVPPSHRAFLNNTVFSITYGDYYFVHAGIRPGVPLAKQKPEDQMWIRGDFLFSTETFDKMIIHGHTIKPKPEAKRNRIGIDTGAFATGHLTCLVLDGTARGILST